MLYETDLLSQSDFKPARSSHKNAFIVFAPVKVKPVDEIVVVPSLETETDFISISLLSL